MFNSLRTKVFLAVVLILAVVTGVVMFFTNQDVEQALVAAENRSASNVLHLLEVNVEGRYRTLLTDKIRVVRERKASLETLSHLAFSTFAYFNAMEDQGMMNDGEAKFRAAEWLEKLEQDKTNTIFVFNTAGTILASTEPERIGEDINGITDMKGRNLVTAAFAEAGPHGSANFTYSAQGAGELPDRFALVSPLPDWGWMVAVQADIIDVQRQVDLAMRDIVKALAQTLPDIQVVRSGFVFVFKGSGELIVPPPAHAGPLSRATSIAEVDPKLLESLKAATDKDGAPIRVLLPGDDQGLMETYVAYFKPLDWFMVSTAPVKEIAEPAEQLIRHLALIFGAVLAVCLILAWTYATAIARPLTRLAAYAKDLPKQDFTQPAPESTPIDDMPRRYRDEVGRLAEAFTFMDHSLRENIRHLMETTAAKERIQSELTIARDIQIGLLPKIFPPFPDRREMDLHAVLISAKEVGGDLFDYFFLDDRHLVFAVGDVADKGVPAALFMAITKTLLKVAAEKTPEPGAILERVNDDLSVDNPNAMFVTLFIAILDVYSGEMAYGNAGHNKPILVRDGETAWIQGASGPACGVMDGIPYKPLSTTLKSGDAVLVYTDGVTEAMSPVNAVFGDNHLLEIARDLEGKPAMETVKTIMDAVHVHANGANQSDDITMLCLRWNGPPKSKTEPEQAKA
ncbi:MAG: SpoIIE family protein phosphatase [Rhodospirillum sp.]|nr:SpoIIE family protein phosphatase [Rhodospirillum sp.]MCF8490429.1 SpoIIE family protein phosphatase [Rhodospirillum sp.]MCF8500974.1 SpoIIE family protein phosphatase [Rhodospirillum sp.]